MSLFQAINRFGSESTGIFMMTMDDYINGFLPDLTEAKDLLESLSSVDDIENLNIGRFYFLIFFPLINLFFKVIYKCFVSRLFKYLFPSGEN